MINTYCDEGEQALVDMISGTRVGEIVAPSERLSEMVDQVTEIAGRMFNGCGSSVLLVEKEGSALTFKVATGKRGKNSRGIGISAECGIASWVACHRKPLIVNDISKNSRFSNSFGKTVDTVTGFVPRSVMCAPLVEGERVIGVIEVVNKTDGTDFHDMDLKGLVSIASVAALPICFLWGEEVRKTLVSLAVKSRFAGMRMKAIDVLSVYGDSGIPDILKIVNKSITQKVGTHGLTKIKEMKERQNNKASRMIAD
jgi:signal transduction protein with GAF and PtsI domain